MLDIPQSPSAEEFHDSIRVQDLPRSVRFHAWFLNTWLKEWTHRYATFIHSDLNLNFVLVVSDGKTLHHDTLYHLGVGVAGRGAVIAAYHQAITFDAHVEKPPRTTWKGTYLHELWLTDPDVTLIEIYARLTDADLAHKPTDELPEFLVSGIGPDAI
ncbi:glyoxalase/bleomycin resistance/dioxygenase family protein [Vreelandella andesensis]|uniref:Glyoxalase/bleomycin resistance/dioxygenase family protein n=1 Tax=Vreelandella andesensis TaxID=447567 RepID=A0A433KL63_9GAMM|nr:VOC family protein [Halomonas andesensis]RUR30347.1 glyoxalase/bleomycin resistance/dioxygenase family protein [Halomonas andesensis]